MIHIQSVISVLYYVLVAFVSALLIWNFIRSKEWKEEVLLIIVVVPFLLRFFGLK